MADANTTAPTQRGRGGHRGRGNSNRGGQQQQFRGRGGRGRGSNRARGGQQHGHGHQPHHPHDNISTVLPTITTTNTTTNTTHNKQATSFKVVSSNTPASPEKVIPASHITISNASNNTSTSTTNAPTGLKKPEFSKVAKLQPGGKGYNLVLKVVDVHMVVDKKTHDNASSLRVAEAIVGDDTGVIVLSAKNEQIDVVKRGATIVVRNGRVDVFNKKMRLRVDNWGLLQSFENGKKSTTVPLSDSFTVNTENNVSQKEYETVYTYE